MRCRSVVLRRNLALVMAASGFALLAGCGGGGVQSTPTPTPAPTPTPTPTPVPTPTPSPSSSFVTAEYNRSEGPAFHNAITAWQQGATGQGVTLAIVDSGIDTTNPEFSGRISAASADVAGNRGISPGSDHGTQVALVAAAARNSTGVMGIAYNATIQMLRADQPGSCTGSGGFSAPSGCQFLDSDIAEGVDRAVQAGARVVNLSLGGSAPDASLRDAVARAAAAGVVVVVSAGNDGGSSEAGVDPANPDPFAAGIQQAGSGNVIITGSVDENGVASGFSNLAGTGQQWFLMARGEEICCVYENGAIKITTGAGGQQFVTVVNGTSFAAPQVTGAVALLAQAFPNLTGAQIVDLLLRTARDAGTAGTDATYGRGILDIARAFQPQGTTSLAGTSTALPITGGAGTASTAMGDALEGSSLGVVILDDYSRAYSLDLAARLRGAPVEQRLGAAVGAGSRAVSLGNERLGLSFALDGRGRHAWAGPLSLRGDDAAQSRVLSAAVVGRLGSSGTIGFAWRQGASALTARLQARREPAFLIAPSPGTELGVHQGDTTAIAWRQMLGRTGLTISAERGDALSAPQRYAEWEQARRRAARQIRIGVAFDRTFGGLDTGAGLAVLREDQTVLGARFDDSLASGSTSLFASARTGWQIAPEWRLGASGQFGWTRPDRTALIMGGSRLLSSAWAVDVERAGVFGADDALALRVSQPLRVESGGLSLWLPVGYDYQTGETTFAARTLGLAPRGREVMGELAWRGSLGGGALLAGIYYRRDPGHYASLPDDTGVAFRWSRGF